MTRTPYLILPLCTMIMALLACGNEPAEEKGPTIFGDLYVRFLQEEGQLKAEASFFEGDSLSSALPKEITGGVAFLGSGMALRNLDNRLLRYQYESGGPFPENCSFHLRDEQGRDRRFATSLAPLDSYTVDSTIQKSTSCRLQIAGPPLGADESLVLFFSDGAGKAMPITLQGPLTDTEIVLSETQLAPLQPGTGKLYLVKKQRKTLEEPPFSVRLIVEYYTDSRTVTIVE